VGIYRSDYFCNLPEGTVRYLVECVQDLKEYGHSLVLFGDDRQMLILNGFSHIKVGVELGVKGKDRLIVRCVVARDEGGTELQKHSDKFRSRCPVRGVIRSRRIIK
jgi:hypothetical protein